MAARLPQLESRVYGLSSNGGRVMSEQKTCANPACTCVPEKGEKYCSAHCEGMGDKTEIVCKCGHEHCGGNA